MRLNKLAEILSEETILKLLKLKKRLVEASAMEKRRNTLLQEAARLEKAIARLRESDEAPAKKPRKVRKLSAAARKRIGAAQKLRWAKIRKHEKAKAAQAPKRGRKLAAASAAATA